MCLGSDLVLIVGVYSFTHHICVKNLRGRNKLARSLHSTSLLRSVNGRHSSQTPFFIFPQLFNLCQLWKMQPLCVLNVYIFMYSTTIHLLLWHTEVHWYLFKSEQGWDSPTSVFNTNIRGYNTVKYSVNSISLDSCIYSEFLHVLLGVILRSGSQTK